MKIGILTHPLVENYGGIMQAVALQGYLSSLGHDVVLIRKHRRRAAWRNWVIRVLELVPFQNIRNYRYLHKKKKKQLRFIEQEFPERTSIVYKKEQLKEVAKLYKFDAVIVGSDQVWRMKSVDDGYYGAFFLDFIEDESVRKVSYAASFGVDYWEAPSELESVTRLLSRFDAVSVRESSGLDICRKELGYEHCELVLDPTMLVRREFYNQYIGCDVTESECKKVVMYVLDKNKEKLAIAEHVKEFASLGGVDGEMAQLVDINGGKVIKTIPEWLSDIKSADFVVTDSFHGMVFSIIFKKEFVVVLNDRRGRTRFLSLLQLLGLESRAVSLDSVGALDDILRMPIDFSRVEGKVESLRASSESFLEKALQQYIADERHLVIK